MVQLLKSRALGSRAVRYRSMSGGQTGDPKSSRTWSCLPGWCKCFSVQCSGLVVVTLCWLNRTEKNKKSKRQPFLGLAALLLAALKVCFQGAWYMGVKNVAPVNIRAEPGPPHEETCPLWLLQMISAVFQSHRARRNRTKEHLAGSSWVLPPQSWHKECPRRSKICISILLVWSRGSSVAGEHFVSFLPPKWLLVWCVGIVWWFWSGAVVFTRNWGALSREGMGMRQLHDSECQEGRAYSCLGTLISLGGIRGAWLRIRTDGRSHRQAWPWGRCGGKPAVPSSGEGCSGTAGRDAREQRGAPAPGSPVGWGNSVAKGWSRSSGCCPFLELLPKDCTEPHRLPAANVSSVTQRCALIPRYVFCQALSVPPSPPCQRPRFYLCACGDMLLFVISQQHPVLCMTPLSFPYPSFVYQVFSAYWQVTLLPPSTPAVPGGFL